MRLGNLHRLSRRLKLLSAFAFGRATRCLPFNIPNTLIPKSNPYAFSIMDVPSSRFPVELLGIIQQISESHFVAVDLEFSGIARRRPNNTGKLTLQEYYEDSKEAAEKYQVLQVGLTIVKEDLQKGRYVARPYNFNISPLSTIRERYFHRIWSYSSGAVTFLIRNGFKFDLPLTQGIQYLSRHEEQEVRSVMQAEQDRKATYADMTPNKDDEALISHIRTAVRAWQSQAKDQQAEYLNIPAEGENLPEQLNRYQVRLTHQIVRNEYPNLKTVGMGHFVQVTNPTEQKQASDKLILIEQREKEIAMAVGFRYLFESLAGGNISNIPAELLNNGLDRVDLQGQSPQEFLFALQERLRSKRRVLVGHNCFTDMVYLYKCFVGPLPPTVQEFQAEIHILFPAVIDTKHIASFGSKRWGNTSLDEIEMDLRREPLPRIHVPAEYDRYHYVSKYHEAGYDSLMTANCAIKASAKMEREGKYIEAAKALGDNLSGESAFGVDNDDYVSATESIHSSDELNGSQTGPILGALKTPMTAFKRLFSRDVIGPSESTGPTEPASASESQVSDAKDFQVVAAKHKTLLNGTTAEKEIEQVRKRLGKTNIYDVLEKDSAGPASYSSDDDGLSFSSGSSPSNSPAKSKNLETMVTKGEVMPRWEGVNGFWRLFVNRLQVNGSQEGICQLDTSKAQNRSSEKAD